MIRRGLTRLVAASLAAAGIQAAITGSGLSAARAAVRVCQETVSSEIVTAGEEMRAKKEAMDQWRAKAAKFGPGYDAWQLAAGRSLKCFKKDGGFECVALGRPCVIQQNPNQRPVGKDRKGLPL